jgi:hypothetical protein
MKHEDFLYNCSKDYIDSLLSKITRDWDLFLEFVAVLDKVLYV